MVLVHILPMRPLTTLVVAALFAAGCGASPVRPDDSPLIPATLTPASGPAGNITFSALSSHGAAITSHTESGYTLTASGAAWTASTSYGNPKPFIQFTADKGQTVDGQIDVAAGGAAFAFVSVDLYASVVPIPYTITGKRNGAVVFTVTDRLPNTFGTFRTVASPLPAALIDQLTIRLTNAVPACCANPMGVDNLIFGQ
jgi:hypothetical protein